MNVRPFTVVLLLTLLSAPALAQVAPESDGTSERYAEDFDTFWRFVAEEYV